MPEVKSITHKFTNTVVTAHVWSSGTAILHVTTVNEAGQTVSVLMNKAEFLELAAMLTTASGQLFGSASEIRT